MVWVSIQLFPPLLLLTLVQLIEFIDSESTLHHLHHLFNVITYPEVTRVIKFHNPPNEAREEKEETGTEDREEGWLLSLQRTHSQTLEGLESMEGWENHWSCRGGGVGKVEKREEERGKI